jgi:hypothetical protein
MQRLSYPAVAAPLADARTSGGEVIDAQALPPSGTPCPNCGCPVEPDDKFCPACGSANAACAPPQPRRPTAGDVVDATIVAPSKHFRCEQCGAEVRVDPQQRSYVCPFCDSTYVVEFTHDETGRQQPEFVIGFAITPDEARHKFRQWIQRNHWFNPGDLSVSAVEEKQRGVYLPFWSFPMLAESDWSASIGEHWQRTETYTTTENGKLVTKTRTVTETEWWPLDGRHHKFYTGYLVSGSKGLPQGEALRILPFNLPALKRYEPYYLAGWLCEEYSIDRESALQLCQQEYYEQERRNIRAFLPGDTASNLEVQTRFRNISSDLCLLPVYVLSYRYHDRLFRFLVNGQTGRVAGDKPISWQRIAIAVGIGAAVIALLVLLGMILAHSAR